MKKTLSYQDCLDEVAYKYGFSSFEEVDLGATLKGGKSIVNLQEEAAEKYAGQFKRESSIAIAKLVRIIAKYEQWLNSHESPVFKGKDKRGLMLLDFAKQVSKEFGVEVLHDKKKKK